LKLSSFTRSRDVTEAQKLNMGHVGSDLAVTKLFTNFRYEDMKGEVA